MSPAPGWPTRPAAASSGLANQADGPAQELFSRVNDQLPEDRSARDR
jgi:hypothetical protein